MRILVVAPEVPFPPVGGGALRTYHLLGRLSRKHWLTLVAFGSSPQPAPFPIDVRAVPWELPAAYVAMQSEDAGESERAYKDLAHADSPPWIVSWYDSPAMGTVLQGLDWRDYDVVLVEHSYMGWILPSLPSDIPTILDLHNVHSRTADKADRESGGGGEVTRLERFERRLVAQCAACVAVSDMDADFLCDKLDATNVYVVPNGVDTSYFHPVAASPHGAYLLFTGLLDYGPNVQALQYFVGEILPAVRERVPEARLHIAGARPAPEVQRLASASVEIHPDVESTRPYFDRAAVCVVPLLEGGGTRLKILEAAASGKAIVSTSKGAEGLDLADAREIFIADSAQQFADAVVRLCRTPLLREALGARARRASLRYDWTIIGDRFTALVESLQRTPFRAETVTQT